MRATAVVIGAGHAGLAMSRRLSERSVDHVVLDRGDVADSWRTKRRPGLRLLTPSWMIGLPGQAAGPPDPHGFLSATEVADLVRDYSHHIDAPVQARTAVRSVARVAEGYEVRTDGAAWQAGAVVVATGASAVPVVPS